MSYIENVYNSVVMKNKNEVEFHQAVKEVLMSIEKVVNKKEKLFKELSLLERLVEPERIISFRVPWIDKNGKVQVNRGYRVQFNSSLGPYKGGIRFHESVNQSILKFLGFEQIFKNSLTGLPIGGGKGGADFNPKGKTDMEVMSFCQSFMSELYKYIGKDTDVPAGDIGVGAREVGYMFGEYKKLTNLYEGVFTGKGIDFGGSLARKEATGFGVVYMIEQILKDNKDEISEKVATISGSGNVAIYAAEKFMKMGGKVITMSDSDGFILDEKGINIKIIKEIKEVKRGRIKDYIKKVKSAKYFDNKKPWNVKCDIAIPCATQNEINVEDVKNLIKNGCKLIVEGSNMPTTNDAIKLIKESKILYMPGKAANAGGVSVSALEMSQNSIRYSWTFDEVDEKLKNIMANIFYKTKCAMENYGGDYQTGCNIAGFEKVANAMIAQGIV